MSKKLKQKKKAAIKAAFFRLPKKPVIASQSADWRGNPFLKYTTYAFSCKFAVKRLRIPTSLRSAKQVPLGSSSE